AVVGLFQLGEVGGEETAVLDVAEHELAAERGDPALIRNSACARLPLVVVVHRDGVGEAVLFAPAQDLGGQREQVVQRAAAPAAVLPDPLAAHPAVGAALPNAC